MEPYIDSVLLLANYSENVMKQRGEGKFEPVPVLHSNNEYYHEPY